MFNFMLYTSVFNFRKTVKITMKSDWENFFIKRENSDRTDRATRCGGLLLATTTATLSSHNSSHLSLQGGSNSRQKMRNNCVWLIVDHHTPKLVTSAELPRLPLPGSISSFSLIFIFLKYSYFVIF